MFTRSKRKLSLDSKESKPRKRVKKVFFSPEKKAQGGSSSDDDMDKFCLDDVQSESELDFTDEELNLSDSDSQIPKKKPVQRKKRKIVPKLITSMEKKSTIARRSTRLRQVRKSIIKKKKSEEKEESEEEESEKESEEEESEEEESEEEESEEEESEEEESEEEESEEESEEEESEKESEEESDEEYTNDDAQNDEAVKKIIDTMMEQLAMEKSRTQEQEVRWKANLSEDEIKTHQEEFDAIFKEINVFPTIGNILKVKMPFKEKCDLVEKVYVFENLYPNTFEHTATKHEILGEIKKYRNYKMTPEICKKYEAIEQSVSDVGEETPMKYQILDANIPNYNKSVLFRKYNHLVSLSTTSSEHPKLAEWIKCALTIPFTKNQTKQSLSPQKITEYLVKIQKQLNKDVYGLDHVKEQLLFVINSKLTTPNSMGSGLAIVGPPGTAKTSLIQALAKAIDLPMAQIALGGAKDSSFLDGHGYTYEGSTPGAIVNALRKLKCNDGIIFFDEFDKISNTPYGAEISRLLLHITDFTQNHTFHDKYLSNEFPIDLSNIWFIYSLNHVELLDRTLRDRIPIIKVRGYSQKEKKEIALMHLIPKTLKNLDLNSKEIKFSDDAIDYLVQKSEQESVKDSHGKSGVRQLKHSIEIIVMKLNLLKTVVLCPKDTELKLSFSIKNFALPFTVLQSHIDIFLKDTEEEQIHLSMYM